MSSQSINYVQWIVGLRWRAIDFEGERITINHTVIQTSVEGKQVVISKDRTKNKSSCSKKNDNHRIVRFAEIVTLIVTMFMWTTSVSQSNRTS